MNWWKAGTYVWTANAAAWCVLAYVSRIDEAWLVAGGCLMAALLWRTFYHAN